MAREEDISGNQNTIRKEKELNNFFVYHINLHKSENNIKELTKSVFPF